MRGLAKVLRTITSCLPRPAPWELNSDAGTSRASRWRPAGALAWMPPAGKMWSVVTLSPADLALHGEHRSRLAARCGCVRWKRKLDWPPRWRSDEPEVNELRQLVAHPVLRSHVGQRDVFAIGGSAACLPDVRAAVRPSA